MAYSAHDIDDGVRSGLLTLDMLDEVPLVAQHRADALAQYPALASGSERRLLAETLRRLLSTQVGDLIEATRAALSAQAPDSLDAVRAAPPLVRFSPAMREQATALKRFLFAALYRHPQVERTTNRAREVLRTVFSAYAADPAELPARASCDVRAGRPSRPGRLRGGHDRPFRGLREHQPPDRGRSSRRQSG
jgi:dGTPase